MFTNEWNVIVFSVACDAVPLANQLKTASIAPEPAEDTAVKGGASGDDASWKQC